MTLEEFKKAVGGLQNANDLIDFFITSVQAEKDRGIAEARKEGVEAANLRKFKIALEKLGYDGKTDLDGFVSTVTQTIEGKGIQATGELGELQKKINTLQAEFSKTQTELKTEREARAQIEATAKTKTIESALMPKLSQSFFAAPAIIKSLQVDNILDLGENGEVVFKPTPEKTLSMDDGLKWLETKYPDGKKNTQQPGAGSAGGTQKVGPKYSMDQIKAMSQAEVQANLADVNASLAAMK